MITAIEIENFKGIADRIRIDLKPITLLFGANSSGKSTIIHALHYAREVLVRQNLDADRTEAGGEFIDLGGFRNFVHNRDLDREIHLRFALSLPEGEMLPYFGRSSEQPYGETLLDLLNHVRTAEVEIVIAWSRAAERPYVKQYLVDIDGSRVGTLAATPDTPHQAMLLVERLHPWLNAQPDSADPDTPTEWRQMVDDVLPDAPPKWFELPVEARHEALPSLDSGLSCPKLFEDVELEKQPLAESMMHVVNRMVLGPGKLVRDVLRAFRYIGPLREKPPRAFEAPRFPDPSRWTTGIAAWDTLYNGNRDVLEEVGEWLSEPSRLAAGCWLRMTEYKELEVDNPLMSQLMLGHAFDDTDLEEARQYLQQLPVRRRLFLVDRESGVALLPHDVGEGISQIVPVVVALLEQNRPLTAVEQPELHVHPAVQVGIGDLLIEAVERGEFPVVLETHSEHLLLRLLRRIRESGENALPPDVHGLSPSDLSVVFLDLSDAGIRVTSLRIDETGEFIDRWPQGFFEERLPEV
ncbi:MAG: AAA family ATPase [Phycisphaerae bacterium]|nr:AAA family ATPase [Phycisphaerae bacterium]